jgi:uncharacterized membrane protein YdbT with pleckstrin-like domain|tara:strand:- start:492 stop:899 length:408 start_codon:yes stop_codon:yes gene_type:complete
MTLEEKQLYIGRPSQILNIISFIIWSWTLFVPIIIYLKTRFTVYEVTDQRIKLKTGILNQEIDECELYRVRDYKIVKPFFQRIFGLGKIELVTSDRSNSSINLNGIKNPENLYDLIRDNVEKIRRKTGTREIDVE